MSNESPNRGTHFRCEKIVSMIDDLDDSARDPLPHSVDGCQPLPSTPVNVDSTLTPLDVYLCAIARNVVPGGPVVLSDILLAMALQVPLDEEIGPYRTVQEPRPTSITQAFVQKVADEFEEQMEDLFAGSVSVEDMDRITEPEEEPKTMKSYTIHLPKWGQPTEVTFSIMKPEEGHIQFILFNDSPCDECGNDYVHKPDCSVMVEPDGTKLPAEKFIEATPAERKEILVDSLTGADMLFCECGHPKLWHRNGHGECLHKVDECGDTSTMPDAIPCGCDEYEDDQAPEELTIDRNEHISPDVGPVDVYANGLIAIVGMKAGQVVVMKTDPILKATNADSIELEFRIPPEDGEARIKLPPGEVCWRHREFCTDHRESCIPFNIREHLEPWERAFLRGEGYSKGAIQHLASLKAMGVEYVYPDDECGCGLFEGECVCDEPAVPEPHPIHDEAQAHSKCQCDEDDLTWGEYSKDCPRHKGEAYPRPKYFRHHPQCPDAEDCVLHPQYTEAFAADHPEAKCMPSNLDPEPEPEETHVLGPDFVMSKQIEEYHARRTAQVADDPEHRCPNCVSMLTPKVVDWNRERIASSGYIHRWIEYRNALVCEVCSYMFIPDEPKPRCPSQDGDTWIDSTDVDDLKFYVFKDEEWRLVAPVPPPTEPEDPLEAKRTMTPPPPCAHDDPNPQCYCGHARAWHNENGCLHKADEKGGYSKEPGTTLCACMKTREDIPDEPEEIIVQFGCPPVKMTLAQALDQSQKFRVRNTTPIKLTAPSVGPPSLSIGPGGCVKVTKEQIEGRRALSPKAEPCGECGSQPGYWHAVGCTKPVSFTSKVDDIVEDTGSHVLYPWPTSVNKWDLHAYARTLSPTFNINPECVCGHPKGAHTARGCWDHDAPPGLYLERCPCEMYYPEPDGRTIVPCTGDDDCGLCQIRRAVIDQTTPVYENRPPLQNIPRTSKMTPSAKMTPTTFLRTVVGDLHYWYLAVKTSAGMIRDRIHWFQEGYTGPDARALMSGEETEATIRKRYRVRKCDYPLIDPENCTYFEDGACGSRGSCVMLHEHIR